MSFMSDFSMEIHAAHMRREWQEAARRARLADEACQGGAESMVGNLRSLIAAWLRTQRTGPVDSSSFKPEMPQPVR
jgi:hypothetical protein